MIDYEILSIVLPIWIAMYWFIWGSYWFLSAFLPTGTIVPAMVAFIHPGLYSALILAGALNDFAEHRIMFVRGYEILCCTLLFAGVGVWHRL